MHRAENESEEEGREGRERATRGGETRSSRSFEYLPRINYSAPLSEPNPTRGSRERERENAVALPSGSILSPEDGPSRRRAEAQARCRVEDDGAKEKTIGEGEGARGCTLMF